MHIRQATLTDLPHILQLVSLLVPAMNRAGNFQWDHTYPNEEAFRHDMALQQLWIAEDDGQVAGIAAITTDQYPGYAEAGLDLSEEAIVIHRLAVHPAHQGKGVAMALALKAEEEAERRQIRVLRIDTLSKNTAAQRLFLKMGYVFSGPMTIAFRPGLPFFCYEKRK